ncbi:hypothetical protein OSTOST_25503 [Ostertagia ostertagi]
MRKACQLGLCVLVGDGVHDLQPSTTNKTGQLYIIRGVMPNSVDFRLLYAICARSMGGSERLRILLDYEKAAITAAKRCFPSASVQGCAFHLAQAWNRKRDALGLHIRLKGRYGELMEQMERQGAVHH